MAEELRIAPVTPSAGVIRRDLGQLRQQGVRLAQAEEAPPATAFPLIDPQTTVPPLGLRLPRGGLGLRQLDASTLGRAFSREPVRNPAELFEQLVMFSLSSGVPQLRVGGLPEGTPLVGFDLQRPLAQTDLARLGVGPGDLLIGIVESTPRHPRVAASGLTPQALMRFGDHAFFLTGDVRNGQPVLQSIESPAGQWRNNTDGRYADRPVRFYRLELPASIDPTTAAAYTANIRAWAAILASHSRFPSDDYRSGDPVAAYNAERAATAGDLALRTLLGDRQAQRELENTHAQYCSELIYSAVLLGLSYPLNQETLTTRLGAARARDVLQALERHNAFVDAAPDGRALLGRDARNLHINLAPDNLRPIAEAGIALNPPTNAERAVIETLQYYAPVERLDRGALTAAQLAAAHAEIFKSFRDMFPMFVLSTRLAEGRAALQRGSVGDLARYIAGFQHTPANHEEYWAGIRERMRPFGPNADGSGLYVAPSFFANMPGQVSTRLVGVGVSERFLQRQQ